MKQDASLDELLCALLFMLSRQARFPHVDLSAVIREHLLWLADHPDEALQRVRPTSRRLAGQWGPAPVGPGEARMEQPEAPGRTLH
jgi:hypothetical protein